MSSSIRSTVLPFVLYGCIATVVLWFIKSVKTALFSPLRTVPCPVFNRWSRAPLYLSFTRQVHYVHSLHEEYGPCVRTGPNQIAFSDPKDVKAIHKMGSGFLKAKWYERLMLRGTLVSLIPSKEHAARRKHFSKAFSQQNLLEWESVIKSKIAFRIAAMKSEGHSGEAVDILSHFKSMATEVVVELCYGESTDPEQSAARNALVQGIRSELLLPQSERVKNLPLHLRYLPLPITRLILRSFGPPINTKPLKKFEKYHEGRKQTILSKALAENASGIEGALPWPIIVKEAVAFFVAGTDTLAVTSTYLIWAVLKHRDVHDRLKEELTTKLYEEPTISEIQRLPYLHCVIQETLRLYGAVSTALQRRTPQGGCQVGKVFVPEGTTVTTQAFTLHRNPDTFDDPLSFVPERWENPTLEMKEAFMPFGIGARGCIGMQLAQIELAVAATFFFREFPNAKISSVMREKDMELEDRFVMNPRGQKCMIIVE